MAGKRIVICCDGTWNRPDTDGDATCLDTNVVKIARAVLPQGLDGVPQKSWYDPGVGTAGPWLRRVFDGATGRGLSRNILQAYAFLTDHFQPGDAMFFFGFSRGAFTVRSLAGLIRNCGILRPEARDRRDEAYAMYRSRKPAHHPDAEAARGFRAAHAWLDRTPIHFIGVWDTVGSLGNPLLLNGLASRRYRFHDTRLSSTVGHAFHALAVDESRPHFRPTLWQLQPHAPDTQVLEQAWFPGVHSNVGGGYPDSALADVALLWMADKARACGLALGALDAHPDPAGRLEDSRRGFYRLLPRTFRPIAAHGRRCAPAFETLHAAVHTRRRLVAGWRPPNLLEYLRRFPPPADSGNPLE